MDSVDRWARCDSGSCPHQLKDFQRCTICDVIIYDRPMDTLKDVPFEELLIASPRNRVPKDSELADITKRLKGENALIELDAKTKFKKQRDYVLTSLHQVSPGITHRDVAARSATSQASIPFKQNATADMHLLFPKLEVATPPLRLHGGDDLQSVTESIGDGEPDTLNLTDATSLYTSQIRIHLPPFSGESIVVNVDSGVSAMELVEAVVVRQGLDQSIGWYLRWTDDDDACPDFDLGIVDGDLQVMSLNATELCLCNDDYDSDS